MGPWGSDTGTRESWVCEAFPPPLTHYVGFSWASNSALMRWKHTPNLLHWFSLDLLRLHRDMFTVWYGKWYFRWQH